MADNNLIELKITGENGRVEEIEADLIDKLLSNLPTEQAHKAIAAIQKSLSRLGMQLRSTDRDTVQGTLDRRRIDSLSYTDGSKYQRYKLGVLIKRSGDISDENLSTVMSDLRSALLTANVELSPAASQQSQPVPTQQVPPPAAQPPIPRTPNTTPVTQPAAVEPTQPMVPVDPQQPVQPQVPTPDQPAQQPDLRVNRDLTYAVDALETLASRRTPPSLTEAEITSPYIHSFLVSDLASGSGLGFFQRFQDLPADATTNRVEAIKKYNENMVSLLAELFKALSRLKQKNIQIPPNYVQLILGIYAADRYNRGDMSVHVDTDLQPRAVALVLNTYLQYGWIQYSDSFVAEYLMKMPAVDDMYKVQEERLISKMVWRSNQLLKDNTLINELTPEEKNEWSEVLGYETKMYQEVVADEDSLVNRLVIDYVNKYCLLSSSADPDKIMASFLAIDERLKEPPLGIFLEKNSENPVVKKFYSKLKNQLQIKLIPAGLGFDNPNFNINQIVDSRSGYKSFSGYMRVLRNAAIAGNVLAEDLYITLYNFYKQALDAKLAAVGDLEDEDLTRFQEFFTQLAWNESDPTANTKWEKLKPFIVKLPIYREIPKNGKEAEVKQEALADLTQATKNWDKRIDVLEAHLEKTKKQLLDKKDTSGRIAKISKVLDDLKKSNSKNIIPDTSLLIKQMYGFDKVANQADQALTNMRTQQARLIAEKSRKINRIDTRFMRGLLGRSTFAAKQAEVAADVGAVESKEQAQIEAAGKAADEVLASQRLTVDNANEGLALALAQIENLIGMNPELKKPSFFSKPLDPDTLIEQATVMVSICDALRKRLGPTTYASAILEMQQALLKFNNGFIDRVAGDPNLRILVLGKEAQIDGELQAADRVKRLTQKNIISEGLKAA